MKLSTFNSLIAAGIALLLSFSVIAKQTPEMPAEALPPAVQDAQSEVDTEIEDTVTERRKALMSEAAAAVAQTESALQLLEENKTEEAVEALATVTGKLELLVARDPALAMAPVEVEVRTHDLLASVETVESLVEEAEELLDEGQVQAARAVLADLASEVVISTTSIPLATYPDAIKAVAPLVDAGEIEESRAALQLALNTLVITNEVVPLPVLRAEILLLAAEVAADNEERTDAQDNTLQEQLSAAREQLQLAQVLGYGDRKAYKPIYKQIDEIEQQLAAGGKGWFDEVKQRVSNLMGDS